MGLVPDIIMEEMYDDSQLMSSDNLENVISSIMIFFNLSAFIMKNS